MAANLNFVVYAFKLAQLTSFESTNSFELSTQIEIVGLILLLTKYFLIGSRL